MANEAGRAQNRIRVPSFGASNCSFRIEDRALPRAVGSSFERRAVEGESPVRRFASAAFRFPRVGLFEIAALIRVVDPIQS
jgi:hypothetical protein